MDSAINMLRLSSNLEHISCSGTVPVSSDDLILLYRKEEDARFLNFANAPDVSADSESLRRLAKICDPINLDGENGNRGTLKTLKKGLFLSPIDVEKIGMIDIIRADLLEGFASGRPIRAELQELCINEKDSFVKPQQESESTSKDKDLIGKLVVILPTKHEGGQLVFRSGDKETVFDSANAIREYSEKHPGQGCVAYAAFYNTTSYEVARITSGFRVSLSFDLYFNDSHKCPKSEDETPSPAPARTPLASGLVFKAALARLLADPAFLPEGGYLGFGLSQNYPLKQPDLVKDEGDYNETVPPIWKLEELMNQLRGSDAMLARVCKELGLLVELRMLYSDESDDVLMERILLFSMEFVHCEDGMDFVQNLQSNDGKLLDTQDEYHEVDDLTVHWVTRPHASDFNELETNYMLKKYCNDFNSRQMFGQPCFVIHIGPHGSRSTQEVQ